MNLTPLRPIPQPPIGLARRRQRLSDQETEERMLRAASAMIERSGLTVSLDHISFEDVIQQAAVSRSAVYRRWPYKDLFFSDLLKELARAARPAAVSGFETTVPLFRRIALEHLDWLETPELRHNLVLELMRQGALNDFETMFGSTEWRTYLALHATFLSVADDDLRRELQEALGQSERAFIARISAGWAQLAGLFGYRLRPELGATFETIATLASATLRGLVIMALSTPEIASRRLLARPFGAVEAAEWSEPALTAASIAFAFLEPDPTTEWSDERLANVRQAIERLGADPS
jgi:AcrR family transcriptional regulator